MPSSPGSLAARVPVIVCVYGWRARRPDRAPEEGLPVPKILVADDESAVRLLVRAILAEDRPGWEVVEATDGVQALQLALLERPALAFVDLHMPSLDGIAVCRAI